MGIPVQNEEMVSARDFVRGYKDNLRRLTDGEVEQLVLTRHGQLQAVILTPERLEELLGKRKR